MGITEQEQYGHCPGREPQEMGTEGVRALLPRELWNPAHPPRPPRTCPVTNRVRSPPSALHAGSPGAGRPLGLPGSRARTGCKDSSCSLHPLATGAGRGGTGGSHVQVQPGEPPEEGEFEELRVLSSPGESAGVLENLGQRGPRMRTEPWFGRSPVVTPSKSLRTSRPLCSKGVAIVMTVTKGWRAWHQSSNLHV